MHVTKDFCLWLLLFLTAASIASAQSFTVTDLGALGGTSSGGLAINDQGDVVGEAILSNGAQEAFLWTSSAGMRGLGS
jgi:probable HAF family extracellular repeat protein